eukprot:4911717-Lingulodinium_polyedra.AAC.1
MTSQSLSLGAVRTGTLSSRSWRPGRSRTTRDPRLDERLDGVAGMAQSPARTIKICPTCVSGFYFEEFFCNLYEDDETWVTSKPAGLVATASVVRGQDPRQQAEKRAIG